MKVHKMKLNPDPFGKIKYKSKDIEFRLFDEKRKLIQVNDIIEFTNTETQEKMRCIVLDLIRRNKFSEIFDNKISKERSGFNKDGDIDKLMNKYYSEEKVLRYGVLGIVLVEAKKDIYNLHEALEKSWSKKTCYEKQQNEWSSDNPALGQCFVTTLVANDHLGGEIVRAKSSSGVSHYWNRVGDEDIDFTREQFPENEVFTDTQIVQRENLKENSRYKILKERVSRELN